MGDDIAEDGQLRRIERELFMTFFDEGLVEFFDFLLHTYAGVRFVVRKLKANHSLSYRATNIER